MSRSSLLDDVTLEIHFSSVGFCRCERSRFRHDLKIALVTGAKLTVLHVEASPSTEWQDFPGVRDTLERWGSFRRIVPRARSAARHRRGQSYCFEQRPGKSLSWFSGKVLQTLA